jgi:diguanylate cyclase (GGDEF)-like protein
MDFFNIDMKTILVVLVLGHFLTGILIASYTVRHNKDKSVDIFLLSKLCQLVAWIIVGFKNTVPGMLFVCVGNSLVYFGASCELIAFLILINQYSSAVKRAYRVLVILSISAFNIVTLSGANEGMRIVAASLVTVSIMTLPVYKILRSRNPSVLQKIIVSVYVITMVSLLCRAYDVFFLARNMTLWSTNITNTWMFLLLYLVMIVGSMGFVLLAKEKQDSEIVRAATFDELTGIFNRRTFLLHAKEVIALFARKEEPISYLLMDIDDFKKINDLYGHYAGDLVLQDFAVTIKAHLREYDLFGRYGGEEFAVLLPGADEKTAAEVGERLREAIENSSVSFGEEIRYAISIGAVTVTASAETSIDQLYRMSDKALYLAKARGKNCVFAFQNADEIGGDGAGPDPYRPR